MLLLLLLNQLHWSWRLTVVVQTARAPSCRCCSLLLLVAWGFVG
jgi:hypothetical protein